VEHEERELAAGSAARSAHVLHITPRLGGESARLLQSALSKGTAGKGLAQLVIVRERQDAYDLVALAQSVGAALTPLTVPARSVRLLERNPMAVVGTSSDLLSLVRSSALKLENVRHVVLQWADAILADERQASDLETLLSETPRDADRTLIVEQPTAPLEAFVERAGLKPRRLTHELLAATVPRTVSYLVVAAEQRGVMLQRFLDARDATSIAVVADDSRAASDASASIQALGMELPQDARIVGPDEADDAALVVWYGVPASIERIAALTAQSNAAKETVALVTPHELQRLRAVANAVTLVPLAFPGAIDEAAQRLRTVRDELSSLLRREAVDSELVAIEPLLAQHDAAEVAAAALRLLGRARVAAARAETPVAAPRASTLAPVADQPWTRLFLGVGERDGARRGDLVGAITGEAEISGSQIGKIEMRETYSLVDVATPVADKVVERLTGVSIRGRRVTARLDRGGGSGGSGGSGGRPGAGEGRRGAPRRENPGADDAPRSRGPRAAREHEEWSSRGERLRHARRPPAGDEP
jgi:ATP-dependent RNA helicase DeaD